MKCGKGENAGQWKLTTMGGTMIPMAREMPDPTSTAPFFSVVAMLTTPSMHLA